MENRRLELRVKSVLVRGRKELLLKHFRTIFLALYHTLGVSRRFFPKNRESVAGRIFDKNGEFLEIDQVVGHAAIAASQETTKQTELKTAMHTRFPASIKKPSLFNLIYMYTNVDAYDHMTLTTRTQKGCSGAT